MTSRVVNGFLSLTQESNEELSTQSIFGSAKASQEADNILLLQKTGEGKMTRKYLQVHTSFCSSADNYEPPSSMGGDTVCHILRFLAEWKNAWFVKILL